MDRAFELAGELCRAGWIVLSGGAVGIDAAAHRGALAAGGTTVAVVAGGITHPYPARNAPLFAAILESGGAVVCPFPDDEPLQRWHFVRRNEVMAELAQAVIVVEASARSGSRHTADAALRLGRMVGACPGSAGTARLLDGGAALIESVDDVLAALDGKPRRPAPPVPPALEGEIARIFAALDGVPRSPEELAVRSGLPLRRVAAELVALELDGLALPAAGGEYLRAGGNGSL